MNFSSLGSPGQITTTIQSPSSQPLGLIIHENFLNNTKAVDEASEANLGSINRLNDEIAVFTLEIFIHSVTVAMDLYNKSRYANLVKTNLNFLKTQVLGRIGERI